MGGLPLDALLEDVEATAGLDVAILLTRTGEVLAGGARGGLRPDVIGVMAATMTASVDTLLEELRVRRPDLLLVEAGGRRFVVSRTGDDNLLVLAAPSTSSKRQLVASTHALQAALAKHPRKGKPRTRAVVSPP
jgi:predicted regulator of Ras-like GTPase activity (Roadblock/LC7/MglB family)